MNKDISKIFIPKLTYNELSFVKGKGVPAIIMDAYLVAYRKKVADKIRQETSLFIIDPNTNYFVDDYCKKKPSFKSLSTTPKKPYKIDELLTDEGVRKYEMVLNNIRNQINNNAGLIILPYLYMDSIDDVKFNLNLTMISDGLRVIKDNKIKYPTYAMINIGNNIFNDYSKIDFLIGRYFVDFKNELDGYFVMINNFDCRRASKEELLGLAYLTFRLSGKKDLYFLKMGDYGEILCSIGATGYSSSLAGGETFNADNLSKKKIGKIFGRNHKEITYVAELFIYLNDEILKKIKYSCDCEVCKGNIPSSWNDTRMHFLNRKLMAIEELNKIEDGEKIKFMISKINNSIEQVAEYNSKFAPLSIKADFLLKWKQVLKEVINWKDDDSKKVDTIDLDKIIEEARKSQ